MNYYLAISLQMKLENYMIYLQYYQKCGGNMPRLKYLIILNEVFQNNEIK